MEDLQAVPGIGPKAAQALKDEGINNVGQLVGKYMSYALYEGEGTDENPRRVDVYSMNQHLWHYFQTIGVNSVRSGIVNAINQKVAQAWPEFADDAADYGELENDGGN